MTGWDLVSTPVGPCSVEFRDGRVVRLTFGRAAGARRRPSPARSWLSAWFAGRPVRVPMDLSGVTPFERRVYEVVRRIPRGATLTYGEVARRTGRPGAARAVGRAMGRNPVSLFVP